MSTAHSNIWGSSDSSLQIKSFRALANNCIATLAAIIPFTKGTNLGSPSDLYLTLSIIPWANSVAALILIKAGFGMIGAINWANPKALMVVWAILTIVSINVTNPLIPAILSAILLVDSYKFVNSSIALFLILTIL